MFFKCLKLIKITESLIFKDLVSIFRFVTTHFINFFDIIRLMLCIIFFL